MSQDTKDNKLDFIINRGLRMLGEGKTIEEVKKLVNQKCSSLDAKIVLQKIAINWTKQFK